MYIHVYSILGNFPTMYMARAFSVTESGCGHWHKFEIWNPSFTNCASATVHVPMHACLHHVCMSIPEELIFHCPSVFEKAGVDLDQPLVASCGSGITASILVFAAYMLHKDIPIYDVRMMSCVIVETS